MYACGVMLNEMMAKQMPFAGMGVGEIRSKVNIPCHVVLNTPHFLHTCL